MVTLSETETASIHDIFIRSPRGVQYFKTKKYDKLTSAWLPEVRTLPHFVHFKQGLCQSLPSEVTFSAKT